MTFLYESQMIDYNPLSAFLLDFQDRYRAGERPQSITSVFGTHSITYVEGEHGWASIGFSLPEGMRAELLSDSGEMEGIRIYLGGA